MALYNSIKKRSQDLSRIGIIFSGGIDSVLIAKITKEFVPNVTCYTSGIAGSDDIKFSKIIADELDLDIKINELDVKDIENMLPNILNIIETNNSTQAEVSIPVFGALNLAAKDGLRVVFTGQGADELFGGYSWYGKIFSKYGYKKLKEYMIQDLLLLYKETLEREDKLAMANSIEMREPFLDSEVVKTATSINMNLNIINNNDSFGKRVHRELAIRIGIPKYIAYREKQAAQHGAGIRQGRQSPRRRRVRTRVGHESHGRVLERRGCRGSQTRVDALPEQLRRNRRRQHETRPERVPR